MYKITITKIIPTKTEQRGEWTIIDRVPWLQKDLEDKHIYGTEASFLKDNQLREVRGYAPDRVVTENKEVQILAQVVDEIDLGKVIQAINNL
jgi:hypothetical protein